MAFFALLVCSFLIHPPGVLGEVSPSASITPSRSLQLDDPPEPLVPRTVRSERDEDHLHALAHFSAGRALQQRKEYAQAIGHYQRALRYDPSSKDTAWSIVALTEQLKWNGVCDRYLLKAAKLDPDALDPADLVELVDLISSDDDLRWVSRLFEEALADRKGEKPSPLDIVLRWRLAEIYVAGKDYGKAADCAAGVIRALENPEQSGLTPEQLKEWFESPHPPYWLFAEYFMLADRLAEAEALFEKAHEKEPDAGRLHFQLARIDKRRQKPADALAHLDICFREHFAEEGVRPYVLLREVLDALDKKEEIPTRIERLVAEDPDNLSLAYFAANECLEAGQLDRAAALYGRIIEKRDSPLALAGLIEVYYKKGLAEELLRALGRMVAESGSLDNEDSRIKAILADKVFLERLFATAQKRFAENPPLLGEHAPMAAALLAMAADRFDLADPFFQQAFQASPDSAADVLLVWGGGWMAEGRYDRAAEIFRRGAEGKMPGEQRPTFYYYLASALEMNGQTEPALEAARKAIALSKDSPLMASHECWVLYHAGRSEPARAAYVKLLDRFDSDHSSEGVRQVLREVRLVLSHLDLERGDKEQAAEWLEQVLDEFPDDYSAMNDLGYLWADQGVHLERSLDMVRRAAEAEPDNAAYRDSLGWALFRLGRLQEAVVVLEKAAEELPEGEIFEHLGEVYHKLGQTSQAEDTWRKASDAYRKASQPDAAVKVEAKLQGKLPEPAAP